MRRIFKIVILIVIIGFVAIQFFQPEKNMNDDTSGLITEQNQIPENIKAIFENSCLDCHSNNTRYWWYDKISPVSWYIDDHIRKGKKELNLSEWGKLDIFDKIAALEDIGKEVERKKMPLKSYTLMHKQARLSDDQIKELLEWIEKYGEELFKSSSD